MTSPDQAKPMFGKMVLIFLYSHFLNEQTGQISVSGNKYEVNDPMNTSQLHGSPWSHHWRNVASPALTEALTVFSSTRQLKDGQILYAKGDCGLELYGVKSGLIRIVAITQGGSETLLGLYTPGTWFGEVSLFDDLPRPVSAYAVGDAEIQVVSAAALRAILDRNPLWYRDFARVLCNKLRLTLSHFDNESLPISVRLVLRLLDLAQAYGKDGKDGVVIGLKLPQEDLGRMLRVTRQSINKELRALQLKGWLSTRRGEITLIDFSALKRLVRDAGAEIPGTS